MESSIPPPPGAEHSDALYQQFMQSLETDNRQKQSENHSTSMLLSDSTVMGSSSSSTSSFTPASSSTSHSHSHSYLPSAASFKIIPNKKIIVPWRKQTQIKIKPHVSTIDSSLGSAEDKSSVSASSSQLPKSAAFHAYCCLISNIPSTFRSVDLRSFFSAMIESSRFKVFQPTHRADTSSKSDAMRHRMKVAQLVLDQKHNLFQNQDASSQLLNCQLAAVLYEQSSMSNPMLTLFELSLSYAQRFDEPFHIKLPEVRLKSFLQNSPSIFTLRNQVRKNRLQEVVGLTAEALQVFMTAEKDIDPNSQTPPVARDRKRTFESELSILESSTLSKKWKCMVQVHKRSDVQRLLREYDNKQWVTHKDEYLPQRCKVQFIPLPKKLLQNTKAQQPAGTLILTAPPPSSASAAATSKVDAIDLTADDKGTSSGPIDLTNEPDVDLPPIIVDDDSVEDEKKISEDSADATELLAQSGAEAFAESELLAAIDAGEFQTPPYLPQGLIGTPTRTLLENRPHLPQSVSKLLLTPVSQILDAKRFKYAPSSADRFRDRSESPERPYLQQTPDDELAQEEWDRDLDTGERSTALDSGRGLEKLHHGISYESQVDNPWDKGDNSGLVHYTDEQYHAANRGDMDEQAADMWDVDADDQDAMLSDEDDAERIRGSLTREDKTAIMQKRIAASEALLAAERERAQKVAQSKQEAQANAWKNSSFLTKMMKKMNYQEGQGLGKNNQGISKPIEAVLRGDKQGLGFEVKDRTATSTAAAAASGSATNFQDALKARLKSAKNSRYKAASRTNGGLYGQSSSWGSSRPYSVAQDARNDFASEDWSGNSMVAFSSHATALPQTPAQAAMGSFALTRQ